MEGGRESYTVFMNNEQRIAPLFNKITNEKGVGVLDTAMR
jgi:hypothetical protein